MMNILSMFRRPEPRDGLQLTHLSLSHGVPLSYTPQERYREYKILRDQIESADALPTWNAMLAEKFRS